MKKPRRILRCRYPKTVRIWLLLRNYSNSTISRRRKEWRSCSRILNKISHPSQLRTTSILAKTRLKHQMKVPSKWRCELRTNFSKLQGIRLRELSLAKLLECQNEDIKSLKKFQNFTIWQTMSWFVRHSTACNHLKSISMRLTITLWSVRFPSLYSALKWYL